MFYIADLCLRANKNFYYAYNSKRPCRSSVTFVSVFKKGFRQKIKSHNSEEPLFRYVGINVYSDQSFDTLGELKDKLEKTPEEIKVSSVAVVIEKREHESEENSSPKRSKRVRTARKT